MRRYKSTSLLLGLILGFTTIGFAQPYVIDSVFVGRYPKAVAYDSIDNKVFVACELAGSVAVIDCASGQVVATIPVSAPPVAVCWNPTNNKIYATCQPVSGPGVVAVIDAPTNQFEFDIGVAEGPKYSVWTATLNKLYTLCSQAQIAVIDCAQGSVINYIQLQQELNHAIWNATSNKLYVCSGAYMASGRVWIIDCVGDTVRKRLTSGQNAWRLTWNPIDNYVFCANKNSHDVTVIDDDIDTIIRMISVGNSPNCILWTDQNRVHVGCSGTHDVYVIRGDTLTVATTYQTTAGNSNPTVMVYNPNSVHIIIALDLQNMVQVFNARRTCEGISLAVLGVGQGPSDLALNRASNKVYVANYYGSNVTIIQDVVGIEEAKPTVFPDNSVSVKVKPNIIKKNQKVLFQAKGFVPNELSVYRIDGTVVHQARNRSDWSWTAEVPAGIYICQLTGQKVRATAKFLVR